MNKTVVEYMLNRLYNLGISDVFGVAGDYAFPIEDTICNSNHLRWIGNCNELNAAYAADGYARIKGMAALSTTFGVGELSAINAIAGSYAENLPIFHLVGMPASGVQKSKRLVHHTLGNGDFDIFYQLAQRLACAHAILTPENCITEMERLIATALKERRPVYIGLPSDYAVMPVIENTLVTTPKKPISDKEILEKVVSLIIDKLTQSNNICVLPGILSARLGLSDNVQAFIDKTGLPYATMFMDKSILSESNTQYIGMYDGQLMTPDVREFVENSEYVLGIGAMMTDFNTGSFTANIKPEQFINIMPEYVEIDSVIYSSIYMEDILFELTKRLPNKTYHQIKAKGLEDAILSDNGEITAQYLYPRLEKFFKPNDIIIAETGTSSMGLGFALLPEGAQFHNQTLWGSIGWATPASFGAALAAPNKRVILITGEGSHQLTVQEISQFVRFGLKPIILILNNDGYLIERLLCDYPEAYYNDLAQWNYHQLPKAFGAKDWHCEKVTTIDELNKALEVAESTDSASYIEIVTERYEASELAKKLKESKSSLYSF
ncbi:alpha-keto acid decarboxylase family protein [Proteus penneri]|uniref:alpha-keto acid decarboxylase family protein n=1 Tax=Proteus TaxID=583 RepID=UPI000D6E94D7|nr:MULTISPECIES: thiamine pyrophosphate-dependent enzyme [Proteus]MCO8051886.1 thiamine pyrophosphate-binding protein [Proteus penneri]NBM69416.1 alpha-keto acid decarboxylase family protein [Proteus sp. G2663]NBM96202.1 alpha-keto acid decarboxylase family protein [Proteus sp. G2660]QPT34389.1 alpha-keto acid decarboxylase family protein [Proteus penneri]